MSGLADLSHEARFAALMSAHEQLICSHEELVSAHEELKGRCRQLEDKVAELEHLLSRNSGNSSMPPSSDDQPGKTPPKGKGRATPKRARGKQKGTPGTNLSWSDAPDDKLDRTPKGPVSAAPT